MICSKFTGPADTWLQSLPADVTSTKLAARLRSHFPPPGERPRGPWTTRQTALARKTVAEYSADFAQLKLPPEMQSVANSSECVSGLCPAQSPTS